MNVLLLTLLQFFYIGGFSFTLPNGFPAGPNGFPTNLMNALPNSFPKGIFNGMPTGMMSLPSDLRSRLPTLNIVGANSSQAQQNNTCCFGATCFNPCPLASGGLMPMPGSMSLPPAPSPMVVPARTYYERVQHDHPPLHKIRKIIRQGRERKRKRFRSYESSADCSTDTDSGSDSTDADSAIDYKDDVIHINV